MTTYPDENVRPGCAIGFEIDNVYVALGTIARTLTAIDGVTEVKARRPFSSWETVHIWFKYRNHDCVVVEPFGDSSRYWIGPKDPNEEFDIRDVEAAFKVHRPTFLRQIVGDVITLQMFRRLLDKSR